MKKPIIIKKSVVTDFRKSGSRKPPVGAASQSAVNYGWVCSRVTKRQAAAIRRQIDGGHYVVEYDLFHFDDSHVKLIHQAISCGLLGNRDYQPGHVPIIICSMIWHAFEFGNIELSNVLLQYLLSIKGVDESIINRYTKHVLNRTDLIDPAGEIKHRYQAQVSRDFHDKLHETLAQKPYVTSGPKPLKV